MNHRMIRFWSTLATLVLLSTMLVAPAAAAEQSNRLVVENGPTVRGVVTVKGIAHHDAFRKWQIDLLLNGAADRATFIALGEDPRPELSVLTELDTTLYPDGVHLLRLRVVHSNLNYEEYTRPLIIANHSDQAASEAATVDAASAPDKTTETNEAETSEAEASETAVAAAPEPAANGFHLERKTMRGEVAIAGVANHPTFRKWQLDLLVNGSAEQVNFIALGKEPVTSPQPLTSLDTTLFPDGTHLLRLRVVHSNLNYEEFLTSVTFANGNPTLETPAVAASEREGAPILDTANAPADGKRWIEVDLSEQTVTAWQGDVPVLHTLVSTGRPQTPTVKGTYAINRKVPKQRMVGPGYDLPNVPSVMYFYRGYAFHGAYWHNNFGQVMSHGCINMRLDEAQALYEWADIGTEVVVHD